MKYIQQNLIFNVNSIILFIIADNTFFKICAITKY